MRALTQYVEARRQCVSDRDIGTFLIADRATPLSERMAQHTFAILRGRLGWIGRGGYPFPRIHDLRHTYVCRTLVRPRTNNSNASITSLTSCPPMSATPASPTRIGM